MEYKFLKPRGILVGVLLALQSVTALALWIVFETVKVMGSTFERTPEGGYTMVLDPQKWAIALLDFWWVLGAAVLCVALAIAIPVVLCVRKGNCCKPMAVMSAASMVCHCVLASAFGGGRVDPYPDDARLVLFTAIRSLLTDLSMNPSADQVLSLVSLLTWCMGMAFCAGATVALVLTILELILLKLNRPKAKETV